MKFALVVVILSSFAAMWTNGITLLWLLISTGNLWSISYNVKELNR